MKYILKKQLLSVGVVGLCMTAFAVNRPDHFTAGFYTRGVNEASYMDRGGVVDPFYKQAKRVSLIPRVTLEASGDDNYFMSDSGEEDSISINLIPGALLIYGQPQNNHLFLDVGMKIPLVQSVDHVEDRPAYFIKGGGVRLMGKTRVLGEVSFRRFDRANRLLAERMSEQNMTANLALDHRVSSKTSVGVNGLAEFHDFEDDAYGEYRRYYGAGRIYRRLTSNSQIFLQGGVGRDIVDENSLSNDRSANFQDLSIGLRGKPTPKTSVSGYVGYRTRQHDESTFGDANGWVASVGAAATPFGLTRFSADLTGDIRPDVGGTTGGSVLDRRLVVGVDRRLFTERLRGHASVQVGTLDYYSTGSRLNDEYWGYTLGLNWWLRHNISFGGDYSYVERQSEGLSSYNSGRWSLRMSWNY